MAENSKIEWTDHSFNPVWGCTKVGPPCDNCYAEVLDHRYGGDHWGAGKPRKTMSDAYWAEPLRWNRQAEARGKPFKVFCASMADVFDKEWPEGVRDRLWALIRATPWLTWQLVTKRIGNAPDMLPRDWGKGYPTVWLLSTVATQAEADRDLPKLLRVPAALHGVSAEPLLGRLDLRVYMPNPLWTGIASWQQPELGWVIGGMESGPHARAGHPEWARTLRDHCAAAGVPFLWKQWGEWLAISQMDDYDRRWDSRLYHPAPRRWPDATRRPKTEQLILQLDGQHLPADHPMAFGEGAMQAFKVGKAAAGRTLDGRTWDEMPRCGMADRKPIWDNLVTATASNVSQRRPASWGDERRVIAVVLQALRDLGLAVVPREPSESMLAAASNATEDDREISRNVIEAAIAAGEIKPPEEPREAGGG